jgi:hypothetical protein
MHTSPVPILGPYLRIPARVSFLAVQQLIVASTSVP